MRKTYYLIMLICCCLLGTNVIASKYPKTSLEKELDEMGSLLKGEGLTFKPKKVHSTSTRHKIGEVNHYMYQAALQVLANRPLLFKDATKGVIVSDWHQESKLTSEVKITVSINSDIIAVEGLQIVVLPKTPLDDEATKVKIAEFSSYLTYQIISLSRKLYLQDKK